MSTPALLHPAAIRSVHAAGGDTMIGGGAVAADEDGQIDQPVPESYENLLEDYSHFAPPAADEVLQGTVLSVTAKDVIVDFGYKSEGIVPIEEFQTPDGEIAVRPGDVVDVMIDRGRPGWLRARPGWRPGA